MEVSQQIVVKVRHGVFACFQVRILRATGGAGMVGHRVVGSFSACARTAALVRSLLTR